MYIDNKTAKNLVKIMASYGAIVVGSYARDSHMTKYKDLDFLTLIPLNKLRSKLLNNPIFKLVKSGEHYNSYTATGKYKIDIWLTTKKNFARDYILRYLPKHKVINLHKSGLF